MAKADKKETTEKEEVKKEKSEPKKEKFVKADLSNVDAKQLAQMQADFRKVALDVRMGKEENTSKLRTMRKDIARAKTILNSRTQA